MHSLYILYVLKLYQIIALLLDTFDLEEQGRLLGCLSHRRVSSRSQVPENLAVGIRWGEFKVVDEYEEDDLCDKQ